MERLTNIGSNGEIFITDNDETRSLGRKESAYKKLAGNGILAKKQPLKIHEIVSVFNSGIYIPQMTKGRYRKKMTGGIKESEITGGNFSCI